LFKLCAGGLGLFTEVLQGGMRIGRSVVAGGMNLSPALLSVGYIIGLNIAILIFIGGVMNWLIAIPITACFYDWPAKDGVAMSAMKGAKEISNLYTRYIGVGGMLVGGLWAIWRMRKSMFSGIGSGLKAYRESRENGQAVPRTERDIPMKWVLVGMIVAGVALFGIYQLFVGRIEVTLPMAAAMLLLGFLFSAVAAYMAGVVGSSNNPISGVTIATVAVSAMLLVVLMGSNATNGPAAAIIIGSVVCCAAAIAGDNMQDLKAGHILGATPWKQQVMQMVGTVSAALVIAPVMTLLMTANGFENHSSAQPTGALEAPQANLMASVAKGVFSGDIPWTFVFIGMGLAVVVIIGDLLLEARKATFRMPVLAVAIGVYLPIKLAIPILIGGMIKAALSARHRRRNVPPEGVKISERRGMLFASGLITGEALIGIALAAPIVITGRQDVLQVLDKPYVWPGVIILAAIAVWMTVVASRTEESS
jgi:putative OPT family oligopeptide transporter